MKTFLSRFALPGTVLVALSCATMGVFAQTTLPDANTTQTIQDNGGVTKTPPVVEKPDPLSAG